MSKRLIAMLLFLVVCASSVFAVSSLLSESATMSNGCSGNINNSNCYEELVNSQYASGNVTRVIAGQLVVPWFSSATACGIINLHNETQNCNLGYAPFTFSNGYCMVTDELSVVAVSVSMGRNETRMQQAYATINNINTSTYGQLTGWRILVNETAGTMIVKDSRTNSNGDSASDADARFIIALFTASNNTYFTNTTAKALYYQLAMNMTRDMLNYDIQQTCYNSSFGSGPICYWPASGSNAKSGGMASGDYSYSGYFADIATAFLFACQYNSTYCAVSGNITLAYLQASVYNGSFRVPPGRSFKWINITGGNSTPVASCTNTCSPDQWDSADAPRAFGEGEYLYYAQLTNQVPTNISAYLQNWTARYLRTSNTTVPTQYYSNGTNSAASQSGYFAQGLQSQSLLSNERIYYIATLNSSLGHYSSGTKTMDSTACYGVYTEGPLMRSFGIGIGRTLPAFGFNVSGNSSSGGSNTTCSNGTLYPVINFSDGYGFGSDVSHSGRPAGTYYGESFNVSSDGLTLAGVGRAQDGVYPTDNFIFVDGNSCGGSILASVSSSNSFDYLSTPYLLQKAHTYTLCSRRSGGSWTAHSDGSGLSMPQTGNTSYVTWFNTNPTTYGMTGFKNILISTPSGLTLTLLNAVNGSNITSWNWNYTTNNGSDNTVACGFCTTTTCAITNFSATNINISISNISRGTYFNITSNINILTSTNTLVLSASQALINVSAYKLFLNTSISTFNLTNGLNTTTYSSLVSANNGTNNVQINVPGNYTINASCTVSSPLITQQCNITGIYDNQFTIGARYVGTIVNNFNLRVTNVTLGGNLSTITVNTNTTTFNLLQGYNYLFNIYPSTYAYANVSLPANASTNTYNFALLSSLVASFTFYDENNLSTVTGSNISIVMTSPSQSATASTTNGTIITNLLIPDTYILRYSSPNYVTRFTTFTIMNNTAINMSLPMLLSSAGTNATVTVVDDTQTPLDGAIVTTYFYDISTNTYKVNQVFTTNNQGVGIITIQLNTGIYYFTVSYGGAIRLITSPTALYSNTLLLTVPSLSNGFRMLFDNNHLTGTITNVSNTFSFIYADNDNYASQGCIYAYQFTSSNLVMYNQSCISSAGGTTSISLDNTSNSTYYLYGVVTKNGVDYTIDTEIVTYAQGAPNEGSTRIWLFVMLLIIVTLIIMFRSTPAFAVIIAGLVPVLFSAAGMVAIGLGITIPLFIIAIIIAVAIGF